MHLTQDEHTDFSEGFWRELFLLKPDRAGLQNQIQRLSVEDVLHGSQVRAANLPPLNQSLMAYTSARL